MKRVILDTNIYGKIIEKGEVELVESLMEKVKDIFVYGSDVARKDNQQLIDCSDSSAAQS